MLCGIVGLATIALTVPAATAPHLHAGHDDSSTHEPAAGNTVTVDGHGDHSHDPG